ncbi:MAG: alpha/beta family hydrolase [Acidimicrobiia bacterium]
MTALELDYDDEVAGSPDRAVLLAHGAGSDRQSAALVAVAASLRLAGIPSLRFDYPYRSAGRRSPDRAPVLEAATRSAVVELTSRTGLPAERVVLGGRSMGGRYCSFIVGATEEPVSALGLVLLAYPLHPAGRQEERRVAHFPLLRLPVLFVSGDRDALGARKELEEAAVAIPGSVTFHWIEGADHAYRVPRRLGRSSEEVLTEVAEVTSRWVGSLSPPV